MLNNISVKLEKIIFILIKGVIFFLPLFFLPWTTEYFEFNKQFLLWLIMPLALFLWLIKEAARGEIKIKTNPLNVPIIIFLALTGASSLFSLDAFSSFFGYFGRFSDAWLGLLSLAIFYFLLVNTGVADSREKIFGLIKLFIYSAAAAGLISLLAMFGVIKILAVDPLNIMAAAWFNPAGGSLPSLAVVLSAAAVSAAGVLLAGGLKKAERFSLSGSLIIFLAVLALVNFPLSWSMLLIGCGLIIFYRWLAGGMAFKDLFKGLTLVFAALIIVSVFFLSFPGGYAAKAILGRNLPKEAELDYKTAMVVAGEAIKKHPVLGSGPGTFSQDFSLYRPIWFNQNNYWQVRFDKSASQLLELPATSGAPAALSYILIISLIVYVNIIFLAKQLNDRRPFLAGEEYNLNVVMFAVFSMLFFSQIFFPANTVLNFIFWMFLGLLAAFWQLNGRYLFKEKAINLNRTVLFSRLSLLSLFFLGALWLALSAFEIRFFAADVIAARGGNREKNLALAVRFNPYRANYSISLAKFYLNSARTESFKPEKKKDNNFIQLSISRSIEAGRRAVGTAPDSVQTNETLAMIYRDIRPLVVGSESWAVSSFKRAYELEPANPVLAAELAKAYFNNNNSFEAEKYFKKSLGLKGDYYEAKFGLAKVYLKEKKDREALALLNELAGLTYDAEVFYELGRFYYNRGEIDKAIDGFKLALSVSPNHINALYGLGIAYEAKGDGREALKYYEKMLKLDPENKEAGEKVKELSNAG